MNKILTRQWESGNFPFNQNVLYFLETIPFRELKAALHIAYGCLYGAYGSKKIFYLEDWHDRDGTITRQMQVQWEQLQKTISSDGALYNMREKTSDVYLAFFPENFEFIARFRIGDIFDEPEKSGIRGCMDVVAPDEILDVIEYSLPDSVRSYCKRENSKKYYDRHYGG